MVKLRACDHLTRKTKIAPGLLALAPIQLHPLQAFLGSESPDECVLSLLLLFFLSAFLSLSLSFFLSHTHTFLLKIKVCKN